MGATSRVLHDRRTNHPGEPSRRWSSRPSARLVTPLADYARRSDGLCRLRLPLLTRRCPVRTCDLTGHPLWHEKADLQCAPDGFVACVGSEFAVEASGVALHGVVREEQLVRDLP